MASFRSHQGPNAICLIVVVLGLCTAAPAVEFAGGTGEPNDPYRIATAGQLIAIGSDPNLLNKHFVLVAGIDLDPNLPDGRVFDRAVIAPDAGQKGAAIFTVPRGAGVVSKASRLRIAGKMPATPIAPLSAICSPCS